MTGERVELEAEEREILAEALARYATPDYRAVRAIAVLGADAAEIVARRTAMDREFIVAARRRAHRAGAAALLDDPLRQRERILDATTELIVAAGSGDLTLSGVSHGAGIPLRTVYRRWKSRELIDLCRRRSHTIWRERFAQRVRRATPDPQQRLFATIDQVAGWVGSVRFRRDQALWVPSSFAPELREDDLREHFAEIDRFATALAADAGLRAPDEFGAFVATTIAGAAAWFDRREAARAASIAVVERFVARARPR